MLLLCFGIYFTLKSRFYHKKAIIKTLKNTVFSLGKGNSSFSQVATALGGTVGVGSIIGIGYGLASGGAGSIFWMWVCSFFGMGLKYAEVKISLRNKKDFGGAPYRLKEIGYKKTAILFCVFCILCSFGMGNLTQVGAMSELFISKGISKTFSAILCCILIGGAVFGGRKRIERLNSFIIPIFSAIYLFACLVIIILNIKGLPLVFSKIIGCAFGFDAMKGGFSAMMISTVLREGFARSLFSNEAGMGSSPLAHGNSPTAQADTQAFWGIFEIFFDTFIVSTFTALCLLLMGLTDCNYMFFTVFGEIGRNIFGFIIAIFAFASVISWCYYGECCVSFLFPKGKKAQFLYRLGFSVFAFLGIYLSKEAIWDLADILNALMTFPNLFLLFICRKEIERID